MGVAIGKWLYHFDRSFPTYPDHAWLCIVMQGIGCLCNGAMRRYEVLRTYALNAYYSATQSVPRDILGPCTRETGREYRAYYLGVPLFDPGWGWFGLTEVGNSQQNLRMRVHDDIQGGIILKSKI